MGQFAIFFIAHYEMFYKFTIKIIKWIKSVITYAFSLEFPIYEIERWKKTVWVNRILNIHK